MTCVTYSIQVQHGSDITLVRHGISTAVS